MGLVLRGDSENLRVVNTYAPTVSRSRRTIETYYKHLRRLYETEIVEDRAAVEEALARRGSTLQWRMDETIASASAGSEEEGEEGASSENSRPSRKASRRLILDPALPTSTTYYGRKDDGELVPKERLPCSTSTNNNIENPSSSTTIDAIAPSSTSSTFGPVGGAAPVAPQTRPRAVSFDESSSTYSSDRSAAGIAVRGARSESWCSPSVSTTYYGSHSLPSSSTTSSIASSAAASPLGGFIFNRSPGGASSLSSSAAASPVPQNRGFFNNSPGRSGSRNLSPPQSPVCVGALATSPPGTPLRREGSLKNLKDLLSSSMSSVLGNRDGNGWASSASPVSENADPFSESSADLSPAEIVSSSGNSHIRPLQRPLVSRSASSETTFSRETTGSTGGVRSNLGAKRKRGTTNVPLLPASSASSPRTTKEPSVARKSSSKPPTASAPKKDRETLTVLLADANVQFNIEGDSELTRVAEEIGWLTRQSSDKKVTNAVKNPYKVQRKEQLQRVLGPYIYKGESSPFKATIWVGRGSGQEEGIMKEPETQWDLRLSRGSLFLRMLYEQSLYLATTDSRAAGTYFATFTPPKTKAMYKFFEGVGPLLISIHNTIIVNLGAILGVVE